MNNLKDKCLNFLPKKKKTCHEKQLYAACQRASYPTIVLIHELCLTTILFLI